MEISFVDGNSFIPPSRLPNSNSNSRINNNNNNINNNNDRNISNQIPIPQTGFKSWVQERIQSIQILQNSNSANGNNLPLSTSARNRQNGFSSTNGNKRSVKFTTSSGSTESARNRNDSTSNSWVSKWTKRLQGSPRGKHSVILFKEEIVFRNLDPATYFDDSKRKIGEQNFHST